MAERTVTLTGEQAIAAMGDLDEVSGLLDSALSALADDEDRSRLIAGMIGLRELYNTIFDQMFGGS